MPKDHTPVPDKSAILSLLRGAAVPVGKREMADALQIKGDDRIALKKLLRELEADGLIIRARGHSYMLPGGLPEVTLIEIAEIDIDGDLLARPVDWQEDLQGPAPRIEMDPGGKGHQVLKPGDRALARLIRHAGNVYEGRLIRRIDSERGRVVGLIGRDRHGFILEPADKKTKHVFDVPQADLNGASLGDLVAGEIQPARGMRRKKIRVIERIGRMDDVRSISLLSLYEAGIRPEFPEKVIAETDGQCVPALGRREDLRGIPLVTIDGADAKDFDDAVFAAPLDDGMYHLIVAIADVSYYVRPLGALDREAFRRGNSTYFPDRVVPMLPEALSNDLCSLRPREDRACLAVHMWIDESGKLLRHKFVRGLMRSQARLTYEQVQAARDGVSDETTDTLIEGVISPLYAAFHILDAARQKRGALELDLPERRIDLDADGKMCGVSTRVRLDSHRLIEEFMVLANVAAAQALEAKNAPCVYRVHDRPSADRLENIRDFIASFGLNLPKGQVTRPAQLNMLLEKAGESPHAHLISQVMLRAQAQARYDPENIGHFGLALSRYAHFTSPIRRYADLIVHRSLVRACGLGEGGLCEEEEVRLEEICEHISTTERVSAEAERSAVDRFTSAYLSGQMGATFAGRISGVTRFGLFVTLDESGADGLVPMRTLPDDFYVHDEQAHALIGRKSRRVYRLGAPVSVRLMEADPMTGSTLLEVLNTEGADLPGMELRVKGPSRGTSRHKDKSKSKTRGRKHKPKTGKPRSARKKKPRN